MNNFDSLFAQADTNNDGSLSETEFRNLLHRNSTFVGTNNDFNNISYDATSTTSSAGVAGSPGGFTSSSYRQSMANFADDFVRNETVAAGAMGSASSSSVNTVQQYETDSQGLFKDKNPEIIRRPAQESPVTYTQNIRVRFLQPPPAPAPGPLIIQEVRPPQPPPPPPLRIRQQAPPLPQPPPLILRERPPQAPTPIASQTIVKNLPAIPVPPRSLIIERIPPAPPKPRDIVIERWIPYGPPEKRKTVVQHAEPPKEYPKPRNIIIQYEAPQVRVIRQFQRLGVTPENPQAYVQRYGASLFDTHTLVQQARAAGVVEDISPPAGLISPTLSSGSSPTAAMAFDGEVSGGGGGVNATQSRTYNTTSEVFGSNNSFVRRGSTFDSFAAADTNQDGVLSSEEFRNAGF